MRPHAPAWGAFFPGGLGLHDDDSDDGSKGGPASNKENLFRVHSFGEFGPDQNRTFIE